MVAPAPDDEKPAVRVCFSTEGRVKSPRCCTVVLPLALALLASCGGGGSSSPAPGSPLDPTQPHYGKTYGDWSAAWWIWLYAQPGSTNPLLDSTGAQCAEGQDGSSGVFFLVGDTGGAVERSCTVPSGLALFFPIINFAADNAGVPPAQQVDDAGLISTLNTDMAGVVTTDLHASLDGADIPNLASYVVMPPVEYSYAVPAGDNIFTSLGVPGVSGTTSPAYTAGYYLMLSPPAPGQHELTFSGHATGSPADFTLTVTYHLTIQ
jgi:hypothetical protein